jgi:hypothetical protein
LDLTKGTVVTHEHLPSTGSYTWLNNDLMAEVDLGAGSLAGLLLNHFPRYWTARD